MSVETILKMIKEVSPDDTAKLDEIDARTHEYLGYWSWWISKHDCFKIAIKGSDGPDFSFPSHGFYSGYCPETGKKKKIPKQFPYADVKYEIGCPEYTRSRDALKAVRPEWYFIRAGGDWRSTGEFYCLIYSTQVVPQFYVDHAPTEELAELHAIIQAIAYERKQDANNRTTA